MDPNEPRACICVGEGFALGFIRLDEAEPVFAEALEIEPQVTDAVVILDSCFLRKGALQRAKELFEKSTSVGTA